MHQKLVLLGCFLMFLSTLAFNVAADEARGDTFVVDKAEALKACDTRLRDRLATRYSITLPAGGATDGVNCDGGVDGMKKWKRPNIRYEKTMAVSALGLGNPSDYLVDTALTTVERVEKEGNFSARVYEDHVEVGVECETDIFGPGQSNTFRVHFVLVEPRSRPAMESAGRICAASILPPGKP